MHWPGIVDWVDSLSDCHYWFLAASVAVCIIAWFILCLVATFLSFIESALC